MQSTSGKDKPEATCTSEQKYDSFEFMWGATIPSANWMNKQFYYLVELKHCSGLHDRYRNWLVV